MDRDYEGIVLGCGGLGSAALYRLAKQLTPAVQFHLGHDRGASQDRSRIVRLARRILSELALDGKSTFPIAAFRLDRPALTDAAFEKSFHA